MLRRELLTTTCHERQRIQTSAQKTTDRSLCHTLTLKGKRSCPSDCQCFASFAAEPTEAEWRLPPGRWRTSTESARLCASVREQCVVSVLLKLHNAWRAAAYLHELKTLIDEQRQHRTGHYQEGDSECVLFFVVRSPHPRMHPHVINDGQGGHQEDQLHHRIVPKCGEEQVLSRGRLATVTEAVLHKGAEGPTTRPIL